MVPWLGSNLAETTSALPLRGRGQAQQKPNSANAPTVEAERDENPAQRQRQEAQRASNREAKPNHAAQSQIPEDLWLG